MAWTSSRRRKHAPSNLGVGLGKVGFLFWRQLDRRLLDPGEDTRDLVLRLVGRAETVATACSSNRVMARSYRTSREVASRETRGAPSFPNMGRGESPPSSTTMRTSICHFFGPCHKFFLKIAIHAIVLNRPSAPQETPWPSSSQKSRREEPAARAVEPVDRIAPRRGTADRRLRILERLTTGLSVAHIARVENLTVRRVRQIIAEMLDEPGGRSAGRLRPAADRPAQRSDDRRAHHDDGGRSSGYGPDDQADGRARPLSRLRDAAALCSGRYGVSPPRGFDAARTVGARQEAREIFLPAKP